MGPARLHGPVPVLRVACNLVLSGDTILQFHGLDSQFATL